MAVIAPIFTGANGGKSDDRFTGIESSFQDSQNIDIRKNSRGISLTRKLRKDTGSTVNEEINCFLKVSNGNIMAFGKNGGVYRKVSGDWYKNSNTVGTQILSCIEFGGYVYFTTSTNLYRIAIGSISNTMTLTVFNALTASSYHPMYATTEFLNIGNNKTIASVDVDGIFLNGEQEFGGTIKYLGFVGGNIKVIIEDKNSNTITFRFFNDITKEVIDGFDINGIDTKQYLYKKGLDYFITSEGISIVQNYGDIQIKKIQSTSSNLNSIVSSGNSIFFGGVGEVWEWGALNKNYPDVLSSSYNVSGGAASLIGAIFIDGEDMYVGWRNGSNYGIDILDSNEVVYNDSGYLITRVYYGDARVIQKNNRSFNTSFAKVLGTDSIKIYYRKNLETNFTTLSTITSSSVKDTDFLLNGVITGDWNFIEFKFELNSGTGETTPELYEFFLTIDYIKQWSL